MGRSERSGFRDRAIGAGITSLALVIATATAASSQSHHPIHPSRPADLVGLPAWDVVPVASPSVGSLRGVHVVAPDDVWAVGTSAAETLIEHWDGQSFDVVPSPNRRDRTNVLEAVDGVDADDVWAVGHADVTDFIGARSLIEHWNGSQWSIVASPNRGDRDTVNQLTGVAAVAPDDVWAVGTRYDYSPGFHPIVMHWDGAMWRFVRNGCVGGLSKVDARSAHDVWAVGGSNSCHYNGRRWRNVPAAPAPNPEATVDLIDATIVGASDVWAVGEEVIECGESVCFSGEIQHWNGTKWSHVTNYAPVLYGVDAVAADDIYAVGLGLGPAVLHYDGRSWSEVPEGADLGQLFDVEGVGGDWWSVGDTPGNVKSPLVEHAPAFDAGAVVGQTNVGGALVSWFGPESGSVQTDPYGSYQVGGLTAGRYTFTATEAGCEPDTATVKVLAGTTIGQDFHLGC
jgi:hypothetical protein